ncbi:hypothetical protein SOPP22_14980 [Shewanella sp. OPT22]|nr:hypothetical protein SOPP22_14980 [Shewanella sp. OPT22]
MKEPFMLRALKVSKQALPDCKPNPPVGCVLVKEGKVVSEGYTQMIGSNHAEVEALLNYPYNMSDVVAYVTLEPCSFFGRTPACTEMLINSGIKNVVVAILDPDSRNSGRGIQQLKDNGIKVDIGVCELEVSKFLEPYFNQQ